MENQDYILFLTKWYPNKKDNQLGVFVQKHATLLAEKHLVKLIYLCPEGENKKPVIEHTIEGNLEVVILYYMPGKGVKKIFNPYLYYRFQKEIYNSFNGEVKHCFVNIGAKSGFLAYYHLLKKEISYSLIEHWSGFVNGKFKSKPNYKKRFYKKLAKKAKSVFAVSEFLRFSMKRELGGCEIKLLPNVIESNGMKKNIGEKNVIITVGDLVDEIKNVSGILMSFKDFLKVQPNYELWIVGGGDSEVNLKNKVKKIGVEKEVIFYGRKNNKETLDLIKESKIYISNSNFETFGMTIAEALLAGLPVISTKSGGPEEFLDESNSIQVPKKSTKELTSAMIDMANNYSKYDNKHISESIRNRFDKNEIREKLESEFTSPGLTK